MPDVTVTRPEYAWEVRHPRLDDAYLTRRHAAVKQVLTSGMSEAQMRRQLEHQAMHDAPKGEDLAVAREKSKQIVDEILADPRVSPSLKRSILDTTSGAPLVRQDLDPVLHALFVTRFPAWERIKKEEGNGLVHAYNQVTSPDGGAALGSSVIQDLTTVNFYASGLTRKTAPIAEFAVGRGVGIKELGAVRGGGAPYDVEGTELANGMVQLARDAQFTMFTGNATNAGGTANNEEGVYNQYAFDGWRGVIGSQGSFAGNGAIQVDQGSLTLFQSIKSAAAQAAQNGGMPSAAFMSYNAKEAQDIELMGMQRFGGGSLAEVDIIPGVKSQAIPYVNGQMTIIPVPGNTMGTYLNSQGVTVEDVYVIDESQNSIAWLFAEGWTVLQLPIGYSNDLSSRFIVFGLYGLVQAAPLFNAKVRHATA